VASAKDVAVIIPISKDHTNLADRAIKSAEENGAYRVITVADCEEYPLPRNQQYPTVFTGMAVSAGVCHARNFGISYVKDASLILPLDADDYLLPDAVERMAAAWQPGKVVYGGWTERDVLNEAVAQLVKRDASPLEMLNRKHICHATYLFAKEDWRRVGGYDPDFNIGAEDWEFMIALMEAGCELVRLDGDPLYVKTIGDNERTHKAIRRKDIIKQLLLEKHPDFMTART
jgi:glycosyltransferase involved in cell wall biosynthesis